MSTSHQKPDETKLRETLKSHPDDWETRKQLAHLLYDQESFLEAADIIWETHEIPSIDVELAFAARILAKGAPRKAIRLLTALLEHNKGKPLQNLALANALLHHGMVLQAVRFYGAALETDPSLSNPDLEHFILWTDDQETLWGDFKNRKPKLGELPWMKRDPKEALKLTLKVKLHITPVSLPGLQPAIGENLSHEFYQQKPQKGAEPTPPPAVTIPLDRVDPKHRLYDPALGAVATPNPLPQGTTAADIEPAMPVLAAAPSPKGGPVPAPAAAPPPQRPGPPIMRPPAPSPKGGTVPAPAAAPPPQRPTRPMMRRPTPPSR